MTMDFLPTEPARSEDALSLFGPESSVDRQEAAPAPVTSTTPPAHVASTHAEAIPTDTQISASGNTGDPGSVVSIGEIAGTPTLRFVEGVAVVQSLAAAIKAKGGVSAGMPDLHGIFLTAAGEVVAITAPGPEPAARELARLLHRLVPADVTPPVGRLFIDRWASGDSTDLTQFSSELDYFARPNGQELLASLHRRYAKVAQSPALSPALSPAPPPVPAVPPPTAVVPQFVAQPQLNTDDEDVPAAESSTHAWLMRHRRQLAVAAVMIMSTVVVTAVATWLWPARTAAAAAPPASSVAAVAEATHTPESGKASASGTVASAAPSNQPPRGAGRTAARPGGTPRPETQSALQNAKTMASAQTPAQSRGESPFSDAAPLTDLPSGAWPDMRIYSGADPGVEPPTLQSAEIPELLISGFPARTNWVDVVVSPNGKVESVKMVGPPQRIPDIMLLSRVKQWAFQPATRNGLAVRYRLVLSWNVTP